MKYLLLLSVLLLACDKSTEPKPDPPSMSGRWTWTQWDNNATVRLDVVLTQNGTSFSGSGNYYAAGANPCTVKGNNSYPSLSMTITYSAATMIWQGTFITSDSISIATSGTSPVNLIRM